MIYQTDLYSFSYKTGTYVPWCKKCGNHKLHRDGRSTQGKQRYECEACGFRGVWSSDLPKRCQFSNVIGFAVEMYIETGISLRKLANKLKKFFKVIVSHETIRQWIKISKHHISRRQIPSATNWHADETYIKIKGVGHYLWIVYCKDTKQVLSWYIASKYRSINHATKVIKDALTVAGSRPLSITTDGLFQYGAAIKKVMGWHWKIHKTRHVIDSGIGKNAIIEEVNKEVKRRIKWFRTFQSIEGANAFFSLWFYHFNQSRFPAPGI